MTNHSQPIGYYLKKTDNLLTEAIDQIQAAFGISRLQWQMLHSIHTHPHISLSTLFGPLVEFENEEALRVLLSALVEKNVVMEKEGLLLTESGQELYTNCWQSQAAFRKQSMAGVSEADYLRVISTLKTIIHNISALPNG